MNYNITLAAEISVNTAGGVLDDADTAQQVVTMGEEMIGFYC